VAGAPEVQVRIDAGGTAASLVIPGGLDATQVDPKILACLVRAAGVVIDRDVERMIETCARAYLPGSGERTTVIALATLPIHGEDGRVEWRPEFNPRASDEHGASDSSAKRTDHYAGQRYVRVKTGDIVAVIREAGAGSDGRDVRGDVIRANAGKAVSMRLHASVTRDSAGRVAAQADGVLVLRDNELAVSRSLTVPGDVDFAVGNVDYSGAVEIAGGVRTGFSVKAAGDLRVGRLIEAAEIACEGHLQSTGGMAGNGRGVLRVGGDARLVYLEKVRGEVAGSLEIDREVVDCQLTVGREFKSAHGTILGGSLAVTGSLVVKTIGSDAYTPTTIVLGDVPLLQGSRAEATRAVERLSAEITRLKESARLIQLNPRPSAADREKLTESSYEISQCGQELVKWAAKLQEIENIFRSRRKLDVHVAKMIYPRVTLKIEDATAVFERAVSGPLWICWDEQRQLMLRTSDGPTRALAEFARITRPRSVAADNQPGKAVAA
jgi:uncharacterized protein